MDKKKKMYLILAALGVAVVGYYLYKKSQAALPASTAVTTTSTGVTAASTTALATTQGVAGDTLNISGNGAIGGQLLLPNIKRWGVDNSNGAGKALLYVNINNGNIYWD